MSQHGTHLPESRIRSPGEILRAKNKPIDLTYFKQLKDVPLKIQRSFDLDEAKNMLKEYEINLQLPFTETPAVNNAVFLICQEINKLPKTYIKKLEIKRIILQDNTLSLFKSKSTCQTDIVLYLSKITTNKGAFESLHQELFWKLMQHSNQFTSKWIELAKTFTEETDQHHLSLLSELKHLYLMILSGRITNYNERKYNIARQLLAEFDSTFTKEWFETIRGERKKSLHVHFAN